MIKIEPKKEIKLGPSIPVCLPMQDHETLAALVEFSGLARAAIIADAVVEALAFQKTRNPEFAQFLERKRSAAMAGIASATEKSN
jgi:hypothetical protein